VALRDEITHRVAPRRRLAGEGALVEGEGADALLVKRELTLKGPRLDQHHPPLARPLLERREVEVELVVGHIEPPRR
jgi:hypothetical protein